MKANSEATRQPDATLIDSKRGIRDGSSQLDNELQKRLVDLSNQLRDARKKEEQATARGIESERKNDALNIELVEVRRREEIANGMKDELSRENAVFKEELNEWRKKEEITKNMLFQLATENFTLKGELNEFRRKAEENEKRDRMRIDELTNELAEYDREQTPTEVEQLSIPISQPEKEKQKEKTTVKEEPKLAKTCDPASIFQLCRPNTDETISMTIATQQMKSELKKVKLSDEIYARYFGRLGDPEMFTCDFCDEKFRKRQVFRHFLSKPHNKKVRAHDDVVSLPALQYWLNRLQEAAITEEKQKKKVVPVISSSDSEDYSSSDSEENGVVEEKEKEDGGKRTRAGSSGSSSDSDESTVSSPKKKKMKIVVMKKDDGEQRKKTKVVDSSSDSDDSIEFVEKKTEEKKENGGNRMGVECLICKLNHPVKDLALHIHDHVRYYPQKCRDCAFECVNKSDLDVHTYEMDHEGSQCFDPYKEWLVNSINEDSLFAAKHGFQEMLMRRGLVVPSFALDLSIPQPPPVESFPLFSETVPKEEQFDDDYADIKEELDTPMADIFDPFNGADSALTERISDPIVMPLEKTANGAHATEGEYGGKGRKIRGSDLVSPNKLPKKLESSTSELKAKTGKMSKNLHRRKRNEDPDWNPEDERPKKRMKLSKKTKEMEKKVRMLIVKKWNKKDEDEDNEEESEEEKEEEEKDSHPQEEISSSIRAQSGSLLAAPTLSKNELMKRQETKKDHPNREVNSLDDLQKARISRSNLAKFVHSPRFKDIVVGCFVKIVVGKLPRNPTSKDYRIAEVIDVVEVANVYNVEQTRTNKGLILRMGSQEFVYRLLFVSSKAFTDSDFHKWTTSMKNNNHALPKMSDIHKKMKDIENAENREVDMIVKEKSRFKEVPNSPTNRVISGQKKKTMRSEDKRNSTCPFF